MEYLMKRIAYLQGLADGLEVEETSKEGKILLELIDLIANLVDEVRDNQLEMEEYVDSIDEDLSELEEYVYDDEDDFDFYDDEYDDYDFDDELLYGDLEDDCNCECDCCSEENI